MNRLCVFGARPVPPLHTYDLVAYERDLIKGTPKMALCKNCQTAHFPIPFVCKCGSTQLHKVPMPQQGALFSYTIVHSAPGALSRLAPYTVGIIDLVNGPRLLLALLGNKQWRFVLGSTMHLCIAQYTDGPLLAAHPADIAVTDLEYEPHEDTKNTMLPISRPDTTIALMSQKNEQASSVEFTQLPLADLPDGDVLVHVTYSALNYKDALAITNQAPIVRKFPMVLGIDLAGEVIDSRTPKFKNGDRVIVNGFGLSEVLWGGYSQYQKLPENVLLHQPTGFSAKECMQIGTAGYTAMLCVMALIEHGIQPSRDAILVSGSTGGVGSIAISLLAKAGYKVIAVTGRKEQQAFLHSLGAKDIISRQELATGSRTLARERWSGAIDVVGGATLASIIAQTRYDGIVACCGMAGGGDLPTSVYPFILRGVTLRGIDSTMVTIERRQKAWAQLDQNLDRDMLAMLSQTHNFADLPSLALDLLQGRLTGRIAISMCTQQ